MIFQLGIVAREPDSDLIAIYQVLNIHLLMVVFVTQTTGTKQRCMREGCIEGDTFSEQSRPSTAPIGEDTVLYYAPFDVRITRRMRSHEVIR